MFNSDFVLSKKGPLARIWLAAHWDKKLTKAQIFETNIESSIERILRPKMKLALRTSGHLMLGVVRIYSRKTKYLLADCNEAFVKIKMAFRPGMVDLPEDHREAAVNAVTLPEVFHDFDSVMPELNNMDIEVQLTLNQSRVDEITMREDYGNVLPLHTEDGFDLGFDASSSDILRHSGFDQSLQQANLLFGESIDSIDKSREKPSTSDINSGLGHVSMDVDMPKDDSFGHLGGGGLFEGGLFEDTPMNDGSGDRAPKPMDIDSVPSTSKQALADQPFQDNDDDIDNFVPPSPPGGSSDGSRPSSPISGILNENQQLGAYGRMDDPSAASSELSSQTQLEDIASNQIGSIPGANETNENNEQSTLLQNEEESFALTPVNATNVTGQAKTKRKRKLIVDEVKNISGEEMKGQLCDTSDIVTTLDLAPPTKRLMRWKESGGVEKLFSLPAKCIPSSSLFKNYQRHLTTPACTDEAQEDMSNDTFAAPAPPVPGKRGRKRKKPVEEQFQEHEPQLKNQSMDHFALDGNLMGHVPTHQDANPQNVGQPWAHANQSPLNVQQTPTPNMTPFNDISSPFMPHAGMTPHGGMTPQWQNPDFNNSQFMSPNSVSNQFGSNLGQMTPAQQLNIDSGFPSWQNEDNSLSKQNDVPLIHSDDENGDHYNLGSVTPWHDTDYDNPPSVRPDKSPDATQGTGSSALLSDLANKENAAPWLSSDAENAAPLESVEERGEDETVEQYEERVLNKRANHLYNTLRIRISTEVTTTFDDLVANNGRKQKAQKFYSLLVLKKHRVLELTQEAPYDAILLTKGPNFDDPKL